MSIPETLAWMTIAATALATWATRAGGFALMGRVEISPRIERFLERLSLSVLVAIVATAVAKDSLRTGTAVLVGSAVITLTRRPTAGIIAGVSVAAIWSQLW